MKASKLLRKVRKDMADPKANTSPYICDNVRSFGRGTDEEYKAAERICEHIDMLLGGAFSLREWLVMNGHVEGADTSWSCTGTSYLGPIDDAKLHATRIAWLDHLISHYEKQGD